MALRLWTARYASPTLKAQLAVKVGISLGVPKWPLPYHLYHLPELAPDGWMLHLEEAAFAIAYGRKLDRLGVDHVLRILEDVGNDLGAIALCWENLTKPGLWCHRRILAAWLEQQTGEVVEELPEA
jgi:hypothetical protein